MPLSAIKVDPSFVADTTTSRDSRAIVGEHRVEFLTCECRCDSPSFVYPWSAWSSNGTADPELTHRFQIRGPFHPSTKAPGQIPSGLLRLSAAGVPACPDNLSGSIDHGLETSENPRDLHRHGNQRVSSRRSLILLVSRWASTRDRHHWSGPDHSYSGSLNTTVAVGGLSGPRRSRVRPMPSGRSGIVSSALRQFDRQVLPSG